MDKIQFQDRIKTLRLERNMTQQELGDLLGVTAQAVSKWETGLSTPDITVLLELNLTSKRNFSFTEPAV